ncbi:uncharacterized protein LOC113521151 [Galleria mellonella]|uniref:Uncharacterized protein LOC113521151 n=1 Tax=Galleria mellonella TaxID=7137 RepID=A0A6J1X7D1_GALME|nr:uncharacterized protein LOC113521151 [Galleria mellonella]
MTSKNQKTSLQLAEIEVALAEMFNLSDEDNDGDDKQITNRDYKRLDINQALDCTEQIYETVADVENALLGKQIPPPSDIGQPIKETSQSNIIQGLQLKETIPGASLGANNSLDLIKESVTEPQPFPASKQPFGSLQTPHNWSNKVTNHSIPTFNDEMTPTKIYTHRTDTENTIDYF